MCHLRAVCARRPSTSEPGVGPRQDTLLCRVRRLSDRAAAGGSASAGGGRGGRSAARRLKSPAAEGGGSRRGLTAGARETWRTDRALDGLPQTDCCSTVCGITSRVGTAQVGRTDGENKINQRVGRKQTNNSRHEADIQLVRPLASISPVQLHTFVSR